MTIVIYLILCWLLGAFLHVNRKWIGGRGVAFVFMVTCFVNTHVFLIFSDPVKRIEVSLDPKINIGFILFKSFFIPLLYTYILNQLFKVKGFATVPVILVAVGAFVLSEQLNLSLGVYRYIDWSIFITTGYLTGLLAIEFVALKWFRNRGWL